MKIDVHNYEEFLLLYIDEELNATEKQMVEEFAKSYPNVQAELNALQAAKLMPEEINFSFKESLYKTQTPQEITTINYQEKFLLYVDEELTNTEKTEVEKFVLHHPNLQNEFVVLKQTKLSEEFIACPNKEDLYKKEKRVTPLFYLSRIAVAAVFVGLIGFAYLLTTKKEVGVEGSVVQAPTTKSNATAKTPIDTKIESPSIIQSQKNSATQNQHVATKNNSKQNQKSSALGVKPQQNTLTPNVLTNEIVVQKNSPIEAPKKQEEDVAVNVIKPLENPAITAPQQIASPQNITALAVNKTEETNNKVQFTQTVYKPLDVENEESNAILVGNLRLNKAKVQNLFKKVGKIFGKSKKVQLDEEETSKKATTTT